MPAFHQDLGVIQITNDPDEPNTHYVDLALLASERYGKLVRQGQNFTITGIQARLRPTTGGYDVGVGVSGSMGYMPTTKHARKAWNDAFQMWSKQKSLKGVVGGAVRHDDLEFCWDLGGQTQRTSSVFSQGMGDNESARMGLFGNSDESGSVLGGTPQYFSLTDFYNSNQPIMSESRTHWDNAVVKPSKYSNHMPDASYAWFNANASSIVTDNPSTTSFMDDALSGAIVSTPIMEFPENINAMCGVLKFTTYVIPDDTDTQNAGDDEAMLSITIFVKSWNALVYPPRRKSPRRTPKKGFKRNSGQQRSKRSRSRR